MLYCNKRIAVLSLALEGTLWKFMATNNIVVLKAQSHLDVWRELLNTVWENHQHFQNCACAPVNHPPTCSKRLSNVSKPTAHRVDTVFVTLPKRFHTVCERVTACQTSIQRVSDAYVPCKYRAQRVCSDRPAVFYRATSLRLPYFPCLRRHDAFSLNKL